MVKQRLGSDQHLGHNAGTVFREPDEPRPIDARALFVRHWSLLRAAVLRHTRQGVLIVPVHHERGPIGELWLEASLDRTRAATLGRHSQCDLVLPGESTALRQLVVMVRAVDLREARVRVIDLQSGVPLVDEAGRALAAVTADAPLFLRSQDVTLIALRTPEPGGWPDDPELAYRSLPERVFVDDRPHLVRPPRDQLAHLGPALGPSATYVRSMVGPLSLTDPLCRRDAPPIGLLSVRTPTRELNHKLDAHALARGVLIGRYERCQLGLGTDLPGLSRVHLLLVQDGDQVLAIDTASTNGSHHHGHPIRALALSDREQLTLASDVIVTWTRAR